MSDAKQPSSDGIQPAPTPLAPTPGAPGEPAPVVINSPVGVTSLTLTVLTSIAVVVALQYMQSVLVPLVIGILVAYALEPFVSGLVRVGMPRSIAAAIVLIAFAGIIGIGVYPLPGQALQIVAQIPHAARRPRERASRRGRDAASAIKQVQTAAT